MDTNNFFFEVQHIAWIRNNRVAKCYSGGGLFTKVFRNNILNWKHLPQYTYNCWKSVDQWKRANYKIDWEVYSLKIMISFNCWWEWEGSKDSQLTRLNVVDAAISDSILCPLLLRIQLLLRFLSWNLPFWWDEKICLQLWWVLIVWLPMGPQQIKLKIGLFQLR